MHQERYISEKVAMWNYPTRSLIAGIKPDLYMDKLFIPIQGCLLEVVREQYTDFRDKERSGVICKN